MSDIMIQKDEILKMYTQKKMSILKISRVLKRSKINISKILKNSGNLKSISQWRKKYKFNESYFNNIDSEDKAYFLGLFFADGNISYNRTSPLIRLTSKDRKLLEIFLKCINSNSLIYREFHNKYKKECFKVQLTSKKMFDDLNSIGCVPRKSLILKFPSNIPKELIHHFIRGYFDGDGTVNVHSPKNSSWKRLMSGFCGTRDFLEVLTDYLPFSKKKLQLTKNLTVVVFSVQDSINLYKYMYRDSTVFLDRKHDIFYNFIKQRGSTTTIGNPSKWRVKV